MPLACVWSDLPQSPYLRMTRSLERIFNPRHESAEHLRAWNQIEKKMMARLYKEAKSQPDQQATEDRAAIAAAVRGSSKAPLPEKPKDYGAMNDAEFKAELAKHGL